MYQGELGEIIGVGQSIVSRMEKQFSELNEVQYKKLCEKFGEEDVLRYVKDNPLANALGRRRSGVLGDTSAPTQAPPSDIAGLIAVVKSQQDEITRLNQRIADLTEIIIEKING